MCANKTDIYRFGGKKNQYHQTIVIALDVEYISLITNGINAIKRILDIGKTIPFRPFRLLVPFLKCCLRLRVFGIVVNQCTF